MHHLYNVVVTGVLESEARWQRLYRFVRDYLRRHLARALPAVRVLLVVHSVDDFVGDVVVARSTPDHVCLQIEQLRAAGKLLFQDKLIRPGHSLRVARQTIVIGRPKVAVRIWMEHCMLLVIIVYLTVFERLEP